jgi:hypothetical protein
MRAENWQRRELEIEGWPVKVTSYEIGDSYITEIEASATGSTIARATGKTSADSWKEASEAASRRLLRTRRMDLTVGG